MKIVTIHQPDFIPWLGFFDRWKKSDIYIVLDDVQFLRRGWHHRDKIKTQQGQAWLTVPVRKKDRFLQTIAQTEIDYDEDWRSEHLNLLREAYRLAPRNREVISVISAIYSRSPKMLIELNMELLKYAASELEISTPICFASEFHVSKKGTERLVELVRLVGGTTYLTGQGSREYLQEKLFSQAGIEVAWQEFRHPGYPQLHGAFEKGLSVIDYLINCGTITSGKAYEKET